MRRGATEEIYDHVQEAAEFIRATFGNIAASTASVGIVLGSGLGKFAESLKDGASIEYDRIPHFPVSKVVGHAGRLWLGSIGGRMVWVMQGRVHHYEGWKLHEVVFPIRVLAALGVKTLILTNAAGGINEVYKPGDLVVITDHINMLGKSPLRGHNDERFGPRFPDMTKVYDRRLRELAVGCLMSIAKNQGGYVGVYACMPGPQYETCAEVRMLRALGADLAGMSTVPEGTAACHMGVEVIGISCVTNMAAGTTDAKLDHAEVVETGRRSSEMFVRLLTDIVTRLPRE